MGDLLAGHRAVVTGGASGIGAAIAAGYGAEGAEVIILDQNMAGADAVAKAINEKGGKASCFELDVVRKADCDALASKIAADGGDISILVNNAGIVRRTPLTGDAETVVKDWDDVIEINIKGVFNVTHAFMGQLRKTKGRVVNIGSIQSFLHVPWPNSAAYTTSKHGVLGFTKALAAELGPDGVRVNAIGPGLIETPLNRENLEKNPTVVGTYLQHTPLSRTGKPADIVGPAIFLASDLSSYVTGGIIMVDGGYRSV